MYFRYVQFFQKTNEKIQPNCYGTSSRIVFVRFLEELKTSKRHFEINWPLVVLPNDDEDVFNVILSSSMVVFLVAICAGEIATGAFVEWKWSHLDVVAVEEWLIEPLVPVEAMEKVCNVPTGRPISAPFSEEEVLLSLSFCYPDDKIESKKKIVTIDCIILAQDRPEFDVSRHSVTRPLMCIDSERWRPSTTWSL